MFYAHPGVPIISLQSTQSRKKVDVYHPVDLCNQLTETMKVQPAILSVQHTCDLEIWSKGPKQVQQGKAK